MRRAGPMAHRVRRLDEEFADGDIAPIPRLRLQGDHNHERSDNRAAPVGDFG